MEEKKESGIETLIELLNEYGEYYLVEHNGNICKRDTDDEGEINIYTDYTAIIITKKFGFIKWLVDNDKIDLKKVKSDFYNKICITDYGDEDRIMGDDNLVIAVLSIQDEPIQFLISILK